MDMVDGALESLRTVFSGPRCHKGVKLRSMVSKKAFVKTVKNGRFRPFYSVGGRRNFYRRRNFYQIFWNLDFSWNFELILYLSCVHPRHLKDFKVQKVSLKKQGKKPLLKNSAVLNNIGSDEIESFQKVLGKHWIWNWTKQFPLWDTESVLKPDR